VGLSDRRLWPLVPRPWDLEGHTTAAHPGWTATYELLGQSWRDGGDPALIRAQIGQTSTGGRRSALAEEATQHDQRRTVGVLGLLGQRRGHR
jgi:hypothetical protein